MPIRFVLHTCTLLVLLSGCAVKPQHATLTDTVLAPLFPVRNFVANVDGTGNYRVSPDGKMLLWDGVKTLRSAILWRPVDSDAKPQAKRFKKNSPRAFWAADSRHILYHSDPSGREQSHVYAIDTTDGSVRDLTPIEGITAWVAKVPEVDSNNLFIAHNGRDASVFDTYRVDLISGESTRIFTNTENISQQLLDDKGQAIVRVLRDGQERIVQLPDADGWRELRRYSRFETFNPVQVRVAGESIYAYSNLDRDRIALSSVDLNTGAETVIYQHPHVDISAIWGGPGSEPLAVSTHDGYPQVHYFDGELEKLFAPLHQPQPAGVRLKSLSRDRRVGTAIRYDHTGAINYLIKADKLEQLAESSSRKRAQHWSQPQPFSTQAADGLNIHGYVTRPLHVSDATPTVLLVHGGPWGRDYWDHSDLTQFLVNRGYTVLQINYRGSTGYGRAHRDAAKGEFAGKMHTDLIDALDWSIAQGYTDPDKVGIMGGSYGGYAALVGMTFTPERFACAVDFVGVSDLATLLENAPPYWGPELDFWYTFVGDPRNKKERAQMNARSPLHNADKADPNKPLLVVHGVNDPRVNVDQSDRMVAALREHGVNVSYTRIGNEGHGFGHWKNQMKLFRQTEDFFARCLGGRSSGFDFYELGSWAF